MTSMMFATVFVLLSALTLASGGLCEVTTRVAVHLSDIHLDPYLGSDEKDHKAAGHNDACRDPSVPWYGVPGCDSSAKMSSSSIHAAAGALEWSQRFYNATLRSVVYYTGDWLRHDMHKLDDPDHEAILIVAKMVADLSGSFGSTSHAIIAHPAVPVAMGNEDFIPDYHFNVSQAGNVSFMKAFANKLQSAGLLSASNARSFAYCGMASTVVDEGLLRVLSLNTLVYSGNLNPPTSELDPCGQFAWMRSQLQAAAAANESVHIMSHIPPSVAFWKNNYFEAYRAILVEFSHVISAQFYGHIHRFGFMGSSDPSLPPLFIGGPVTRIAETVPDFAVMPLTGRRGDVVDDRVQWSFSNVTLNWTLGRSLRQALNIPNLATGTLHNVSRHIMDVLDPVGTDLMASLWPMVEGGEANPPTLAERVAVGCFTLAFDLADLLDECTKVLQAMVRD